jgi:hypothetical protein
MRLVALFVLWVVAAESRDVTVVRETLDRKVSTQGRVMPEKLIAQPYLQRDSRGIVRSIGEAITGVKNSSSTVCH